VAPFKSQNMSNNAAVCADGSEIGRSQAVQAAAARIAPTAALNPILLKPEADSRSQVIVNGRPWRTLSARAYCDQRDELWPIVTRSLDSLRREYDLIVIEGAGSPAELNLREGEIVNMAVARYANAPVLLVGDIDRGGVFAQLLGTMSLLEEDERRLIRGLIVNKFRGDGSLFETGRTILEERGGVPVVGIIPWLANLNLPEEDGQTLESPSYGQSPVGKLDLAVIQFPRIANFDDFDPLQAESGTRLRFVRSLEELGQPAAIILPGTKSTIADLTWLREMGLAQRIMQLASNGTAIVGICGGYQMLGRQILDPDRIESSSQAINGLGLLPHTTTFAHTKVTHVVRAVVADDRHCRGSEGQLLDGYEIHMGSSNGGTGWLRITERSGSAVSEMDGAVSTDGRVWGCYLHGLFANEAFRREWLNSLKDPSRCEGNATSFPPRRGAATLDAKLDELADHVEAALDMDRLNEIIMAGKKEDLCPKT
jgi:adenosylcobyric acid synthase